MIRAISRLSQHQGLLAQAAVGAIYKPDVLNVVTKQALPALSRSFAAAPEIKHVHRAPFGYTLPEFSHNLQGASAAEEGDSPKESAVPKNKDYQYHPVYTKEWVHSIRPQHKVPKTMHEKLAYRAVQFTRRAFDFVTMYRPQISERQWLQRILFLETVAGVPGMVGGMLRHMRSLRTMRRDYGRIHTLLEEAENERMHLLTFMQMAKPGVFFRAAVLGAQGVFFNAFFITYIISPRTAHAFVGYLEEEAVITYSHALDELDAGNIPEWTKMAAPDIAKVYWCLKDDATIKELLLVVRADEANHSHVNHVFSELTADERNPFVADNCEDRHPGNLQ